MTDIDAITDEAIVISREGYESGRLVPVMVSLMDTINALIKAGVPRERINRTAVELSAVDRYCYEVRNGGHSQYSTLEEYEPELIPLAGAGLITVGHQEAIALWEEFSAVLERLPEELAAYVENNDYDKPGVPHPTEQLEAFDKPFYQFLGELEDAYLKMLLDHPDLVILDESDIPRYVAARGIRYQR